MPEIISRNEAIARQLKFYFTGKPCKHGHVAERYVAGKICRECSQSRHFGSRKNSMRAIKEAKTLGLKTYFTGLPCVHGHVSERYISSSICVECQKTHRNAASLRIWRARYYRDLEKSREKGRLQYRKNPRRQAISSRKWKEKNRERWRANKAKWARDHPEIGRAWQKRNPEKMRACKRNNYYFGPKNPTGEMQWLRKNLAQLRSVKRYLKSRRREQSQSSQAET